MPATPTVPRRPSPTSLVRTDLLTRALEVLETLETSLTKLNRRSVHLAPPLEAARARVSERAASVGLAPIASAEELRDLARTLDEVATTQGWVARELRVL